MTKQNPDAENGGESPNTTDRGTESGDDASESTAEVADDVEIPVERIDRLVENAEQLIATIGDDTSGEPSKNFAEELTEVLDEADELLETVDIEELPDAIDLSELPNVIEAESLPDAIENRDPKELIAYRNLVDLVELGELWDSVDVREFWRNHRELSEEFDDVADYLGLDDEAEEDDDGLLGDATSDASGIVGDSDGNPEADMLKSDAKQTAVQQNVNEAVEEFRKGIIKARAELKQVVEENRQRTGTVGQPSSRNPTAVSTMSPQRNYSSRGIAKFSTVPEETKYSTAPNHKRIYGDRFEDEGGDDE